MTNDEKLALAAFYDHKASGKFDMRFAEASRDVIAILDAIGNFPRAEWYRKKYRRTGPDHGIMFWIVCDDVNALLPHVVTVETEIKTGEGSLVAGIGLTLDETKGETLPDTDSGPNPDPLIQTGESSNG